MKHDDQLPTPFDDYEIFGVVETKDEQGAYATPASDDEAEYWSLYGHIPGQGLECIGDFNSRQHAEEIYARITGRSYNPRQKA